MNGSHVTDSKPIVSGGGVGNISTNPTMPDVQVNKVEAPNNFNEEMLR